MLEDDGFVEVSFLLHCAVYALLRRGEVVYVGQSKKPLTRIYTHAHARGRPDPWQGAKTQRKIGFKFDGIWVRPCMLRELEELEVQMIKKYQPRYNIKGMPKMPPEVSLEELLKSIPMLSANVEPRQSAFRRR